MFNAKDEIDFVSINTNDSVIKSARIRWGCSPVISYIALLPSVARNE